MRILLTGVTGFAGSWLAEGLLAHGGCELTGLSRDTAWPQFCQHLAQHVPLVACDLGRLDATEAALRQARPEQIYHLAGYAFTGRSFKEADAAWEGNLTATRTLLEAVVRTGLRPRILSVSSGLIYGDGRSPLTEDSPLLPTSPYASSKAAADLVGYQYHRSAGLEVIRARPFNHIGPRQSPDFATASFSRQLAAIRHEKLPPVLETGDLSAWRDLTDVRDVAEAYRLLMERGRPGEAYNVASGVSHRMSDVVDRLIALAGLPVERRLRPDARRAGEAMPLTVSTEKLREQTGWRPCTRLDQSLGDILEYWSVLS
jgi:GDP-4-dehydro-6-deoxy-D-mannose reductase